MSSSVPNHIKVAFFSVDSLIANLEIDGTPTHRPPLQLLLTFSKFLNFTFTVMMPKDKSLGKKLSDGNWTGMAGMLQREEADVSFEITEISIDAIEFSYPISHERITFVTQQPQPTRKNLVLLQPFSEAVWMILVVCTLAFFLLFYAMSERGKRFTSTFFSTIGNLLGQPFSAPLSVTSQVFLFISWILAISFLIHAFKATFLSFLLINPTKGISTIDELASAATDGSVKCRTLSNTVANQLLASPGESYRIIGKSAVENSKEDPIPMMYFDPNSIEKTALIAAESNLFFFKNVMFISEDSFHFMMRALPMRKKFPGKKIFNKFLRKMIESGLIEKIKNDFDFKTALLAESLFRTLPESAKIADDSEKRLTLDDLKGAFVILGAGLILAFLVFLGEILFFNFFSKLQEIQLLK